MLNYKFAKYIILFTWVLCIQVLHPSPQSQIDFLKHQYEENYKSIAWTESQSNSDKTKVIDEEMIEAKYLKIPINNIWIRWFAIFTVVFLGVITGVCAFYNNFYWKQIAIVLSSIWLICIVSSLGYDVYRYSDSFNRTIFQSLSHIIMVKIDGASMVEGVYTTILYVQKEVLFPLLHLLIIWMLLKQTEANLEV